MEVFYSRMFENRTTIFAGSGCKDSDCFVIDFSIVKHSVPNDGCVWCTGAPFTDMDYCQISDISGTKIVQPSIVYDIGYSTFIVRCLEYSWKWCQSWWRHPIETFSAILALCAGNSPVTGEFPSQRPVAWSSDVFFVLPLNKPLSKQSWGWWFDMPLCPLWHHCTVFAYNAHNARTFIWYSNTVECMPRQW